MTATTGQPVTPAQPESVPSRIDVLLPVFNNATTIRESVDCILQQTVRDFRLIVVDDGSTDGTSAILQEQAAADNRVLVISTPNRGIVSALNTGLEHCSAPLIARHDGDDIAFPDRFERQLRYLSDHPDCVAVAGKAYHIDACGRRIGRTGFHGDAKGAPYSVPAGEPYLMHPFLMVRREAIQAVGGYRHVLHSEDSDLYWRLEPLGRLHTIDDFLGEYRIHSNSISSGSRANIRATAVFSQLGALSARRRLAGKADLRFDREFAQSIQCAGSLEEMVRLGSRDLDPEEREYLEVATAAKMLQLRIYRMFRFGLDDIRTIARWLTRHKRLIPPADRKTLIQTPFWYYYRPRKYLNSILRATGLRRS